MDATVPAGIPRPGDLVAGKYRIDGVLGVGGMGAVLSATHEGLGERVALKFLLPSLASKAVVLERFVREARAAVKLRTEHVGKVYDVGEDEGLPFIVMEYLDGEGLDRLIGRLSIETAVTFVMQSCVAVEAAHATGVVHRDIKPANLMLTRGAKGEPCIKVLDFGLAKILTDRNDLTLSADAFGTPAYMAPEQMRSARDVDERVDIWALGVVLFELVTGRLPFEGATAPELCAAILKDRQHRLRDVRSDVPAELDAIVDRCLSKDPRGRFSSAAELAFALSPFAVPPGKRLSIGPASSSLQSMPTVDAEVASRRTLDAVPASDPRSTRTLESMRTVAVMTPRSTRALDGAAPRSRRGAIALLVLGPIVAIGVAAAIMLGRPAPPRSAVTAPTAEPAPIIEPVPPPAEPLASVQPAASPEVSRAAPPKPIAAKTAPRPTRAAAPTAAASSAPRATTCLDQHCGNL